MYIKVVASLSKDDNLLTDDGKSQQQTRGTKMSRSINEQSLTIKLSVSEALLLMKASFQQDKTRGNSIKDRLEDALMSFYRSKPNILDYPREEWKKMEEIFEFCMNNSLGSKL